MHKQNLKPKVKCSIIYKAKKKKENVWILKKKVHTDKI